MPRIYVACLASYNAGTLHGRWIDATLGVDHITEETLDMIAHSPTPFAEEWAIHDYEGFGAVKLSESTAFDDVAELAHAIEEHGEAFGVFYNNQPDDVAAVVERFEHSYRGTFRTVEEYAEEYIDSTGMLSDVPEHIARYFDVESFARDLELGGDIWTAEGGEGVLIFLNI